MITGRGLYGAFGRATPHTLHSALHCLNAQGVRMAGQREDRTQVGGGGRGRRRPRKWKELEAAGVVGRSQEGGAAPPRSPALPWALRLALRC